MTVNMATPLSHARAMGQSGDYQGVINVLNDYLKVEPDNTEGLFLLGAACFKLVMYSRAREAWNQILAIDPAHRKARNWLDKIPMAETAYLLDRARALGQTGDFKAVVRTCNELLSHYPDNVEGLFLLGASCFKQKQYGRAREAWNQVLRLSPGHDKARRWMGKLPDEEPLEIRPARTSYAPSPETGRIEIRHKDTGEVLRSVKADSLETVDLAGADLRGAELIKANLGHANLYAADLTRANMPECDLSDANIRSAVLTEANLAGANLREANLVSAFLRSATISDANLASANMPRCILRSANLEGSNLHAADLADADISCAVLTDANLTNTNLEGANLASSFLRSCNLAGANLAGADLTRCNLSNANLEGANLEGARLTGAFLRAANLSNANLTGADLSRSNLSSVNLEGSILVRANFADADLGAALLIGANVQGANFTGADLTGADVTRTALDRNYVPTEEGNGSDPSIASDNQRLAPGKVNPGVEV